MQVEERRHKDKYESAHLSLTSQNKKRKKTKDGKHAVIIISVIFHVNNEISKDNHYLTKVTII